MRCLVTAGPTYEPLDEVRRLTNFSTGTLGTRLANSIADAGHDVRLLRGKLATSPLPVRRVAVEEFTTTVDLLNRLRTYATQDRVALFHAAAVSDFRFGSAWKRDSSGNLSRVKAGKLSTRDGTLLVELEPTPKILASLRQWYSNALLVGWKYEVDGSRDDVFSKGDQQRRECRTDLTVVNGPAWGRGFGLVDDSGVKAVDTADELIEALLKRITDPHGASWSAGLQPA
ncbi:MAG: DNA/pantothenate metabolism flavoprotein domain protein [Pedosphaera sp.]|nr:DNA/pantothenate metabolism flavoprotein domain protein [Pedosphaera sp.]